MEKRRSGHILISHLWYSYSFYYYFIHSVSFLNMIIPHRMFQCQGPYAHPQHKSNNIRVATRINAQNWICEMEDRQNNTSPIRVRSKGPPIRVHYPKQHSQDTRAMRLGLDLPSANAEPTSPHGSKSTTLFPTERSMFQNRTSRGKTVRLFS